jgi:hypothetical protein
MKKFLLLFQFCVLYVAARTNEFGYSVVPDGSSAYSGAPAGADYTAEVSQTGSPYFQMSFDYENDGNMKERCLDGRRVFDATYDAWSRLTWELPQTNLGLNYSYFRLLTNDIDAVEYYDGATYVIDENNKKRNGLYMHEYGH